MTTVALGDVVTVTMGQAPPGDSYNDRQLGVPLVAGAGDFRDGRLRASKFTTAPGKLSQVGDIVLSIRASIGARVWSDGEYCLGRGVAGLRATHRIDAGYLWHWLGSAESTLAARGRGATFLQVARADIESLEIPLPPLSEQRRIAAILDRADAIRAKRRELLTHLDALTQSMYQQAVVGVSQTTTLREAGVDFVSGRNVLAAGASRHPINRVIKVNAVSKGKFDPREAKPMPSDYSPPKAHRIRRGDVLFGRASGSIELLGATATVDVDVDDLFLPDKVWRVEVGEGAPVSLPYLVGVLRSSEARAFIRHNASGAAGVYNIAKSRLAEFRLPLPPVAVQNDLAARMEAVDFRRASASAVSDLTTALFASLQSRAFKGGL